MVYSTRQLKFALKYGPLHQLLKLGRHIPKQRTRTAARVISSALYWFPPLRRTVKRNMALALGAENVPAGACREYFNKLGLWASYAMQGYHRGLEESGIREWLVFDESVEVLQRALAGGKGVVYSTPHLIAHEMTAGIMARDYPTVGLVRESKYPPHTQVKKHYYEISGDCNVIYRPRRGNVASDMRVCTRSLRQGNILVITPDLLVKPGSGVAVKLFGRTIHIRPGTVSLAMFTGAPVVNMFLYWEANQIKIHCNEPVYYSREGDREQTLLNGMQDWCRLLEDHLRKHPSSWQFWLDRNWSRVWSQPEQAQDITIQ